MVARLDVCGGGRPSVENLVRDAGMRVLKGTLSIGLAASLATACATSARALPVPVRTGRSVAARAATLGRVGKASRRSAMSKGLQGADTAPVATDESTDAVEPDDADKAIAVGEPAATDESDDTEDETPLATDEDHVAPVVESAHVDRACDRALPGDGSHGELEVFRDAVSVSLVVSDAGGIDRRSIALRGNNSKVLLDVSGIADGAQTGVVSLLLEEDGALLDRSLLVEIKDQAGNGRIWSIGPEGQVRDALTDVVETIENPPMQGHEGYPDALVVDTRAPRVTIEGVAEGACVSDAEALRVSVEESNFGLLRTFDAGQEVVRIRRSDETDASDVDSSVASVGELRHEDGSDRVLWVPGHALDEEGSYVVDAQLIDIAGRASAAQRRSFVVDRTAPVVRVEGIADDECSNDASRTATIVITDAHFDEDAVNIEVRGVRPDGTDISDVSAGEWTHDGTTHTTTLTLTEEGSYEVRVTATDDAGNEGSASVTGFVLDRTAPLMSFTWNDGAPNKDHTRRCYQSAQTLVIRVEEAHWRGTGSEDGFRPVRVEGGGRAHAIPVEAEWVKDDEAAAEGVCAYTCTLVFSEDAEYPALSVTGTDRAGNVATIDRSSMEARPLALKGFTVDTTHPTVAVERGGSASGSEGGVDYYARPTKVSVTVRDRTFDPADSDISCPGGRITRPFRRKERDADGVVTWVASVSYGEGRHVEPEVVVRDGAGNQGVYRKRTRFVVDLTAPMVTAVTVDQAPTAIGSDAAGPIQFFRKGATLRLAVADNMRLKASGATVVDPQGTYTRDLELAKGHRTAAVAIDLFDATESDHDAEFDRREGTAVELRVADVAGNVRTWTLGEEGTAFDHHRSSTENAPLNGSRGNHPLALIEDHIAPVVTLSGVESGAYYNTPQTVHAVVDEQGFAYLQRFDADRAVLHVSAWEPQSIEVESRRDVVASSFERDGTRWSCDRRFERDGRYVVWADVDDYAGNHSNRPRLGPFTIDRTAPVVSVSFDNNDVRNGSYYDAPRTATITVMEHNFDPALFSVRTDGEVSDWSSKGDTHTCTVSFARDGSYGLTVLGKDLAGNEATPHVEPEFVIDTTAPTISFGGRGERLGLARGLVAADEAETVDEGDAYRGPVRDGEAYNGVVAPAITLADERNYDPSGWTVKLVGNKVGDVTDAYVSQASDGAHAQTQTISLADIGAKESDDGERHYDVAADDIYTLSVTLADRAGNTVEDEITFSVNRFGSNYVVSVLDDETGDAYPPDAEMLPQAPRVVIREINVSGMASHADSLRVTKEYAHATTAIAQDRPEDPDAGVGYRLSVPGEDDRKNRYGWSEYVYTIRAANFGTARDSSHARAGGQGLYRVNVASEDAASNGNSTAAYWGSDTARTEATEQVATVEFVLDQQGPSIDAVDLPGAFNFGSYRASFHVSDTLTSQAEPDAVTVLVDGEPAADLAATGSGTYAFTVPARSFFWREVSITVRDYAGRSDEVHAAGLYVSGMALESLVVLGVVGLMAGCAALLVHRGDRAREETPGRRLDPSR